MIMMAQILKNSWSELLTLSSAAKQTFGRLGQNWTVPFRILLHSLGERGTSFS